MSVFTSNWLIFFPLACSLFVAMRLALGAVDFGRKSWVMLSIRSAVLLLFWFSFLSLGLRASWLSLPWMLLVGVFFLVLTIKRRKLERVAFLQSMMAVEQPQLQQQLASYFVAENDGYVRRKARGVLRDLSLGATLTRSLEVRMVAAGVYERLALRLREAYGISLRRIPRASGVQSPEYIEFEIERMLGRLLIFSWVIVLLPVMGLFFRFIMPTFWELFEEFGLEMPSGMVALEDWYYAIQFGWLGELTTAMIFLLSMLLLMTFACILLLWMFPTAMQLPLFRWLGDDYYRTAGLLTLGVVLEHESDLGRACERTGELLPVNHLKRRFTAAKRDLDSGKTVADALQRAKLLTRKERRDWGGFACPDPAWALTQLAGWKVERMLARYSLLVQALVLGLTLSLAAVVGWFAFGVVQVLTQLIVSLS